jgi:poly(A) polymerase
MGGQWRRMLPAMSEAAARALLYRLKPEAFANCALLAWARSGASAQDAAWRAFASLPQRWSAPAFPLKAADLMARGLDKGPALGVAMRAAEEAWIAADFPGDAAALAKIADVAAARR